MSQQQWNISPLHIHSQSQFDVPGPYHHGYRQARDEGGSTQITLVRDQFTHAHHVQVLVIYTRTGQHENNYEVMQYTKLAVQLYLIITTPVHVNEQGIL